MKKFVAMLLVLSMVLVLAGTAMAACKITAGMWVEFKKDSAAYTAAKASKKTGSVVQKGSVAQCDKVCGKYARLIVNTAGAGTRQWFKVCDLKETLQDPWTKVVWAKGGKGMSICQKDTISPVLPFLKGYYLKVSGHTNLRKNCGMKFKSQGVVEKCDLLKMTGRCGMDDRIKENGFGVIWYEICKGGKKLWISENFVNRNSYGDVIRYNKCGKIVPYVE